MKYFSPLAALALLALGPSALALDLPAALEMARNNNPSLRASRHQRDQADATISQERSVYRPSLDVAAGYTVLLEPQGYVTSNGITPTQDRDYPSAAVTAEQTLYDFGRGAGQIAAAAARLDAVSASLSSIEQEVLFSTVRAYYAVLQAEQEVAAARDEVTAMEDHLRVAAALYEQGVVTRNDLLQAEVRVAMSRQQRLDWDNRLHTAWLQLDYRLGQPSTYRAELVDHAATSSEDLTVEIADKQLEQRPDLRAAAARLLAGGAEVRTLRAKYLPQFYLRGEANYVENSHASEETIYSAKVGLRWNLSDGLATSAALRRALSAEEQLRDQLLDTQLAAALEYRTAVSEWQVTAARIQTLQTAIVQAEENLRINRERYREQVGTATEVLDAQTLLTQARSSYHGARYAHAVAQAQVDKALGRLGE